MTKDKLIALIARIKSDLDMCQSFLGYVKARLAEKSTLGGISAAVAAGAVVPTPYSYAIIAIGILAVFVPEAKKNA